MERCIFIFLQILLDGLRNLYERVSITLVAWSVNISIVEEIS